MAAEKKAAETKAGEIFSLPHRSPAEFAAVCCRLQQWRAAGGLAEKETTLRADADADAVPLEVLAAVEQLLDRCGGDVRAVSSEQRSSSTVDQL